MSNSSALIGKIRRFQRNVSQRLHEKRIPGMELGERIRIYDLVCPLRYDILVRADFIAHIAQNDDLSADEFDSSTDNQAAQAYRTWFREVEIRRFYPELYDDESRIRKRLSVRVKKLWQLLSSMRTRGFDDRHPIRLNGGETIHEVNGKSVGASFFAGGGCHRIACLLVMGRKILEPNEYEVAFSDEFRPLDNTSILIDKLPISMHEYLSFVSRGYCEGNTMTNAEEVLAYVEEHCPDRLSELQSVFRYDLIRLAST